MSTNLKYAYGRMSIGGDFAQIIKDAHAIDELMAREQQRAMENIAWSMTTDANNAHIGPQHRPGRTELHEARNRLRHQRYIDSLGRPAGAYRR